MPTKPTEPPPTFDELPRTLFSLETVPLDRYNPGELEALTARPEKVVPLPADADEAKRKRLAGLAQYKGRSERGRVKSLMNLRRCVPQETKVEPMTQQMTSPGVPACQVPAEIPKSPKVTDTFRGKALRKVYTQEEWNIYVETWNDWFKDHPEFDKVEDFNDLHTICREQVIMFRCDLWEHNNPGKSMSDTYNAAYNRQQNARKNLTARRVDRFGSKASGKHVTNNRFNVAVVSGQVSNDQARQRRLEDERDEQRFLESTMERHNEDIIDAILDKEPTQGEPNAS
jgi:hypothetical protein